MIESKIDLDDLMKVDGFSWKIQLALIDLFCRCIEPKNTLEIGTWNGRSSIILAKYVNDKQGLHWGIEPNLERATITENNCRVVCPNAKVIIERNISDYSDLVSKQTPMFNLVHIDGEHSFNAVYHDLTFVDKLLLKEGIIILDDFYFDMYPQITQATYQWLSNNPEYVLLAVGACKGIICKKTFYRKYADMILDPSFLTELNKYKTDYGKMTITRTSPLMDCPTLGISTNISNADYVGNENDDGRIEKIVKMDY